MCKKKLPSMGVRTPVGQPVRTRTYAHAYSLAYTVCNPLYIYAHTEYYISMVYNIPCGECPWTYIGETGRTLDHRLPEHQRAPRNRDVSASAIAEHVFAAGHQVDLSKAMVIDTHLHAQTHCLLESWHI